MLLILWTLYVGLGLHLKKDRIYIGLYLSADNACAILGESKSAHLSCLVGLYLYAVGIIHKSK
jgi:hypothetical protein